MFPLYDVNALTKVWRVVDSNNNLMLNFGEFMKLAEMAIVHIIGFVEDGCIFSSIGFLKLKLKKNLDKHI